MRDTRSAPRFAPPAVRSAFVQAAGRPIAFAFAHLLRLTRRELGVAVMYHRIGTPPGDYTRELVPNLPPDLFESQVRHLKRCYRIVHASKLPEAVASRRRGERIPVAITLDDDLGSHLAVAAPILERIGATATFFLTGASLSAPFRFWWEHLQDAVDRGLPDPDALADVSPKWLVDAVRERPEGIHDLGLAIQLAEPPRRDRIAHQLAARAEPPPDDSGLRSRDIRLLAERGFEIGFHTRRHDYLPNLDDGELARAMHDGRDEIAAAAGTELAVIAYPHGGADGRVMDVAHAAGFRVGYTTEAHAVSSSSDPLLLGRLEAPLTTAGQMAARVVQHLRRAARRSA